MRLDNRRTLFSVLLVLTYMGTMMPPLWAQSVQVAHFVAPTYPPLARQAMISGQVVLELTLDQNGTVKESVVVADSAITSRIGTPNPILVGESKQCVQEWRFHTSGKPQQIRVLFIYGFSGTTRDTDPKTKVTADFDESSTRVFITTDAVRAVQPN